MTVYVDDMYFPLGRMVFCHMWSEDVEELHAMADKIGVQRRWFQNKNADFAHYDVTKGKRALAVNNGAVEVTMREMVDLKNDALKRKRTQEKS